MSLLLRRRQLLSPAPTIGNGVTNRRGLASWYDSSLSNGRTVYVTTAAELTTALSNALAGDDIQLAPGEYNGRFVTAVDGAASGGWITVRTNPNSDTQAKIVNSGNNGWLPCLDTRRPYYQFADLEVTATDRIQGNATGGDGFGPGLVAADTHHVRFADNYGHDLNNGVANTIRVTNVLMGGNDAEDVADFHHFQGSAFSMYQCPNANASNDLFGGAYANAIVNNRATRTIPKMSGPAFDNYSDANCVIIDDFHNEQGHAGGTPAPRYTFRTLVEGNLGFLNGGRCVGVFESDHVDVLLNTGYRNGRNADPADTDYPYPEIPSGQYFSPTEGNGAWANDIINFEGEFLIGHADAPSDDIEVYGNIGWARDVVGTVPSGETGAGSAIPGNTIMRAYHTDHASSGFSGSSTWGQNAWRSDVSGGYSPSDTRFEASDVTTGQATDLLLTDPANGDFRPLPSSPCTGHSFVAALSVCGKDLFGNPRVNTVGAIEAGV